MQSSTSLSTPPLFGRPLKAAAISRLQNPFKICCLKAGRNPARHKLGLCQAWGCGQCDGPGASSLGTAAHRLQTLTGLWHLSSLPTCSLSYPAGKEQSKAEWLLEHCKKWQHTQTVGVICLYQRRQMKLPVPVQKKGDSFLPGRLPAKSGAWFCPYFC